MIAFDTDVLTEILLGNAAFVQRVSADRTAARHGRHFPNRNPARTEEILELLDFFGVVHFFNLGARSSGSNSSSRSKGSDPETRN